MKPLSLAFLLLTAPLSARVLRVRASAYDAPCRKCSTTSRTATGHSAATPGVAVDPRVIRLGSRVRILSRGYSHRTMVADDTGGRIRGRRIDLRLGSHAQARRFGRRRLRVEVRPPLRRRR